MTGIKKNADENNIITLQGISFKGLSKKEAQKLRYREIMFVHHATIGAMGYSGKSLFLLKKGNKIEGCFCEMKDFDISRQYNNMFIKHCENYIPICYKDGRDRGVKYWKRINMGAGNSLYVRRKFFDEFNTRAVAAECDKLPFLYGKWVGIAYQILEEEINQKNSAQQ